MSGGVTQEQNACRSFRRGFGELQRASPFRRVVPLALAAGLAAGCGAVKAVPAHQTGAPKPSPISSDLRAEEVAIHRQVLASLHHDSDVRVRYGSIPGELRDRQAPPAGQVLRASQSHPAMAIQGNGVLLHLAQGGALATAIGPEIPDRVQGSSDLHTPATWDLTFAHVHGTVPISPRLFTITDEQGAVLWPHVSVVGGGPLPKTVPAGRPFTLTLKTVVSVGDGKLRYSPSGATWLAEWDFDVETD